MNILSLNRQKNKNIQPGPEKQHSSFFFFFFFFKKECTTLFITLQVQHMQCNWQQRLILKQLRPRTKPVETNRKNAYFFPVVLAKTETSAKMPDFPPLLSKVVQDSMAIILVGRQTKITLNRRWGRGYFFCLEEMGEGRNCLNSFVWVCW